MMSITEFLKHGNYKVAIAADGGSMKFPPNVFEQIVSDYEEYKRNLTHKDKSKVSISKRILIEELEEDTHPEKVEDVLFWALEYYSKNKQGNTWGKAIAFSIKDRIVREEQNETDKSTSKLCNSLKMKS